MFKNKKASLETYVILSVLLGNFLMAFTANVVPITLPQIAVTYHLNNILQNWVSNIFLISIAIFSIPFGKLSEKYGFVKTYIIGLILFLIGAIGTPLSNAPWILLTFRAIQGCATAIVNVSSLALLVIAVPENKKGTYVGLCQAIIFVAIGLAPVLGGIITFNFDWQTIFYLSLPFIILNIILLKKINKEWINEKIFKFDLIGSILYFLSILFLMYGFTILNRTLGIVIVTIGLILLVFFAIYELKKHNPIFNVSLFKNLKFSTSNFTFLICSLSTFIVTMVLNYYLQYILGWNIEQTGIFLIVIPIVVAVVGVIAGYLADRMNPIILSSIGMGVLTVAAFLFTLINKTTSLYYILFAMIMQGVGSGLFGGPNITTIMTSVPVEEEGTASASVSAVRVIGQSLSMGILTLIFTIIIGSAAITPKVFPQLLTSCQFSLQITTILCFIALIASLIGLFSKFIK